MWPTALHRGPSQAQEYERSQGAPPLSSNSSAQTNVFAPAEGSGDERIHFNLR